MLYSVKNNTIYGKVFRTPKGLVTVPAGKTMEVDSVDELSAKLIQQQGKAGCHIAKSGSSPSKGGDQAKPNERQKLIGEAESLDIEVDRRWSTETLQSKIDEKLAE